MTPPLHVLIVEDNVLDAELLVGELRRAGFEPDWYRVDTEAEYLARLHGGLDLVLSDYGLPQFNGLRALELLNRSGLDVPFILVSGTIGEDLAVEAMKSGAADYLMKDRLARLGPAVLRALNQCQLRREARRRDQTLLENAAFIHDVLNSLTATVAVLDETGNIKVTNEAWRRFAQENGGHEPLHQNYLTVCATSVQESGNADAQTALEGIRRVLDGTWNEFSMEYACHSPTEQRWFLMHVSHLGGTHQGAVVAHEKITARKRAEITLRESEERFRQLIENASDVIAVMDATGCFEFVSPSAQRVLDYRPEDLVGHNLLDYIHPEDRSKAEQDMQRALTGTLPPRPIEYRTRHRDGSWRIFQSVGGTMTDAAGRTSVVVNSRDLTETRKLEEQFLRTQRLEAIGTLSGGIAHDLNNILAPMLMIAPMLMEKLPDPQDRELLTMIEQGAKRGADIIKQLLTFSRGIEGARGPVQARHLLKEMLAIMRETFPRELTIRENLPTDLWPISADATQIHQVLLNLCVNARDAMPAGGRITLAAENVTLDENTVAVHPMAKPGRYVCLIVSDTGEGIPREYLDRIFEPFFTTKEVGKGTGLGLSTVLGIVRSHGGFVAVDSEPGHGTSFKIHLPAMVGATEAATAAAATRAGGNRELILIVDDEVSIQRALRLVLEERNYRVLTAANGQEAVSLFLANRDSVRLLLTDLMMPVMSGVALIRALRALEPHLRVVAASGLQDQDRREELAALGVTTVLAKPFTPEEILEAVQRELAAGA